MRADDVMSPQVSSMSLLARNRRASPYSSHGPSRFLDRAFSRRHLRAPGRRLDRSVAAQGRARWSPTAMPIMPAAATAQVWATPETLAIMDVPLRRRRPAIRSPMARRSGSARSTSASSPPAMCSARPRSCSSMRASGSSSRAITSAAPTRPARRSSRCRATSSSPRRPSACRSSAIPTPAGEIDRLLAAPARQSRALRAGRRLCARQGAAADHGAARPRPSRPDLHPRRARSGCASSTPSSACRSASCAPPPASPKDELQGQDRPRPARRAQRPLVAPPARSDHRHGLGLDAGPPARAPAQRRAAADRLRPCRLGRADRRRSRSSPRAKSGSPTAARRR